MRQKLTKIKKLKGDKMLHNIKRTYEIDSWIDFKERFGIDDDTEYDITDMELIENILNELNGTYTLNYVDCYDGFFIINELNV